MVNPCIFRGSKGEGKRDITHIMVPMDAMAAQQTAWEPALQEGRERLLQDVG